MKLVKKSSVVQFVAFSLGIFVCGLFVNGNYLWILIKFIILNADFVDA